MLCERSSELSIENLIEFIIISYGTLEAIVKPLVCEMGHRYSQFLLSKDIDDRSNYIVKVWHDLYWHVIR